MLACDALLTPDDLDKARILLAEFAMEEITRIRSVAKDALPQLANDLDQAIKDKDYAKATEITQLIRQLHEMLWLEPKR
jgi:dihydrodipicolinate synthase/N-acetylneuraminate lyase